MTIALREDVLANQALLAVDNSTETALDAVLAIEDELVVVRGHPSAGGKLLVARGFLGTAKASHASGATLAPYVATPDGGALPSQWAVSQDGSIEAVGDGGLVVALDTPGYALQLVGPDAGPEFVVDLETLAPKVAFLTGNGAEARIERDGSVYLYGKDDGTSDPWFWMYRTDDEGQKHPTIDFRSDASNRFTIFDDDLNPVFQVREDGSIHIKTGASIVADL